MIYFKAKSDLRFVRDFGQAVKELLALEEEAAKHFSHSTGFFGPTDFQAAVQQKATELYPNYQSIRTRVARSSMRIVKLADKYGIPIRMQSCPPPMVGGVIIPVNVVTAILHDTSYDGIGHQVIIDTVERLEGAVDADAGEQFWKLINPIFWARELIIFALRIPFMLLEATGFDVRKIEDQLWGRVIKTVEVFFWAYLISRGLSRK